MKTCRRCRRDLALSEFTKKTCSPDGIDLYCRKCNHDKYVEAHTRRRDIRLARKREIYASKIDEMREYRVQYYAKNREAVKAYRKVWRTKNPWSQLAKACNERGKHFNVVGKVTPSELRARVEFYGGRCWVCGDPWKEIDHVKPLGAGGANIASNLRPACFRCSRARAGQRLIGYRWSSHYGWNRDRNQAAT